MAEQDQITDDDVLMRSLMEEAFGDLGPIGGDSAAEAPVDAEVIPAPEEQEIISMEDTLEAMEKMPQFREPVLG